MAQNREPFASMPADWLLQENKPAEINLPINDFFGQRALYTSRPEQWTPFTDGFSARGGVGGFYICDFRAEEKPNVSFIRWKKVADKEVHITGIKPISEGRFAAVVEDAKEDTLVILDAKSKDPSKPIASTALADTRRGAKRNFGVNIAIYDCKPESFNIIVHRQIMGDLGIVIPNRLSFQFTEGLTTLESIGSLNHRFLEANKLCHDVIFFKNNYIECTSVHYSVTSFNYAEVYSLNQNYQCDDKHAFRIPFVRGLFTRYHPIAGNANHLQMYSLSHDPERLILAEDFLDTHSRVLSFIQPQPQGYHCDGCNQSVFKLDWQKIITKSAQLFSSPIILPDNRVIYIGSQNGPAVSTIFLYDPARDISVPIYQFCDTKVEEIFLTPTKGNLAVCYRDKDEAVCAIYPIPEAKLTEKETLAQAISEVLPTQLAARDIASVIADYTYQETQTWTDWVLKRQALPPVRYPCAMLRREGLFSNGLAKALANDRIKNISDELEDLQQKLHISIFNLKSKYSEADETKVRDELNSYRQIANERHTELPRLTQLQPCHPDLIRLNKLLDDKWENHFEKQIDEIRKANVSGVKAVLKRGVSP